MQGNDNNDAISVGTVIIWPTVSWQQDMKDAGANPDHWLECNGQAVDGSKYPKLAKIMSRTPNYSGLLLRGHGGNADAIGKIQGDAIRNITGTFSNYTAETYNANFTSGPFSTIWQSSETLQIGKGRYDKFYQTYFDISKIVPTAEENRPVNTAVIFLIKTI